MALQTYTNLNAGNDPVTAYPIDTALGSAAYDRPSTVTPSGGYVATGPTVDYGVGTTPAVRAKCFEPPSEFITLDPGLAVNG